VPVSSSLLLLLGADAPSEVERNAVIWLIAAGAFAAIGLSFVAGWPRRWPATRRKEIRGRGIALLLWAGFMVTRVIIGH
jgi:hypothetical protein